jgi:hypothetical protein
MCLVKANATFHGHKLTDIPVLNPGDLFGKCFLLEIGGSYSPLFLVVEADSVQDAIAELAENTKFGHHIVVPDDRAGRTRGVGRNLHPAFSRDKPGSPSSKRALSKC